AAPHRRRGPPGRHRPGPDVAPVLRVPGTATTAAVITTRVQLPTSRRRNPCAPSIRFPFLDPGAWTVGGILGGSDFEVNLHRPLLQATIQPKSAPERPLTVR